MEIVRRDSKGKFCQEYASFVPAKPLTPHEQKLINEFLKKRKKLNKSKK